MYLCIGMFFCSLSMLDSHLCNIHQKPETWFFCKPDHSVITDLALISPFLHSCQQCTGQTILYTMKIFIAFLKCVGMKVQAAGTIMVVCELPMRNGRTGTVGQQQPSYGMKLPLTHSQPNITLYSLSDKQAMQIYSCSQAGGHGSRKPEKGSELTAL